MIIFGDIDGDLHGHFVAGGQTLSVGGGFDTTIFGDATGTMFDRTRGGDDTVSTVSRGFALYGDALALQDHARGGNDSMEGSGRFGNFYGDGAQMRGAARGGDDVLTAHIEGGSLYGDAASLANAARGGDDVLTLDASRIGWAYGDGEILSGRARGGDDVIVSQGVGVHTLYGDAQTLADRARGGNDVIEAGQGTDEIWGDAAMMGRGAAGGHDTFVFKPATGNDIVHDFHHKEDVILLAGFGPDLNFASLDIEKRDTDHNGTLDSVIHLSPQDSVTVLGNAHLVASDFGFLC